jgi:hypothetical protein
MAARWSETLPIWLIVPIAVSLAAIVGWLDYHASEVQGTVLVIIVITAILSFAAPSHAWISALIMGLSIGGTYVVARAMGIPPTYPVNTPWSTLIALIPAAIGAGCGVAARVALRTALTR